MKIRNMIDDFYQLVYVTKFIILFLKLLLVDYYELLRKIFIYFLYKVCLLLDI
jgi:hypothetical protein